MKISWKEQAARDLCICHGEIPLEDSVKGNDYRWQDYLKMVEVVEQTRTEKAPSVPHGMSDYRVIGVSVPAEKSILDSWRVSIDDEGSGEYVCVMDRDANIIRLDAEEWPALRSAIDFIVESVIDE